MINLEQAKLLEVKVAKAIDYIHELVKENAAHRQKKAELQAALDSYQSRIDELEVLVMRFKEDQGIIEDSILAALDRLSQFEEAVEKCLWDAPESAGKSGSKSAGKPGKQAEQKPEEQEPALVEAIHNDSVNDTIFFEIQGTENEDDITDPLLETLDKELQAQDQDGELDIF